MSYQFSEKISMEHEQKYGDCYEKKSFGWEVSYKGNKNGFDMVVNKGNAILGSSVIPRLK